MQIRSNPTGLYAVFSIADKQNKTVTELLSGKVLPYSHLEYVLNLIYLRVQKRIQQEK